MLWILLKTTIIYFLIIIILRFLGKREVGELSIFDLVILLIIADIASIGIDNNDFFLYSILCLLVLAVLQKVFSLLLLKISVLRKVVDGSPRIIILNGRLDYNNMKHELYTMDDLLYQMHEQHIMQINEIRLGILETNGTLSLFRKSHFDEVVLPVILSGVIDKEACRALNINEGRIVNTFLRNNMRVKDILYATVICEEIIYFYNDNKNKEPLKEHRLKLK